MIYFLHDKKTGLYYIGQAKTIPAMGRQIKQIRRYSQNVDKETIKIGCVVSEAQYKQEIICQDLFGQTKVPNDWREDKESKISQFIAENEPLYLEAQTQRDTSSLGQCIWIALSHKEMMAKHIQRTSLCLPSILSKLVSVAPSSALFNVNFGMVMDSKHPAYWNDVYYFWSDGFPSDKVYNWLREEEDTIDCYHSDGVFEPTIKRNLFVGCSFDDFSKEMRRLSLPHNFFIRGQVIEIDPEVYDKFLFLEPNFFIIPYTGEYLTSEMEYVSDFTQCLK